MSDEGYVYREVKTTQKVKIPDGDVVCPDCNGSGRMRLYWGGPMDEGQFGRCFKCWGAGYVSDKIHSLATTMRKEE